MSKYFLLLFAVLVAGLAGCSKDPRVLQMEREIKGVAHQYWTAFVNNDVKTMKKLLIKEEAREINREDFKDQGDMNFSISLGKVEIKGPMANVETKWAGKKKGGMIFDTVLILQSGKWKVSFGMTMMNMAKVAMEKFEETMERYK